MPSVEDTANPARALRAHLAAHNLRVAVISLLTLVAAVALWLALPQLLLLVRTKQTAGLSLESIANSAISLVGWTARQGRTLLWVSDVRQQPRWRDRSSRPR